jgi:hypothetical protein
VSHMSQLSDNGSIKPARKLSKSPSGRDWLGRSRSQPRLPFHPQDSYVSIASDRSSIDDLARSPPISQPKVCSIVDLINSSIEGHRRMIELHLRCQRIHITVTTTVPQ